MRGVNSPQPPLKLRGVELGKKHNFKAILEYDGTAYHGWQWQNQRLNLQQTFEEALEKIAGKKVRVAASGRTDAGVHALAQVVSFKLETRHDAATLLRALNAHLPDSLVVKHLKEMPEGFHAQMSARRKMYAYFILNDAVPAAFLNRVSWEIHRKLDWKAMKKAFKILEGEHDFKSFQSVGTPVRSTIRTIYKIRVQKVGEGMEKLTKNHPLNFLVHPNLYAVTLESNGFLKQMVRNIIGTVVQVGLGRLKPDDIQKILKAKDRRKAGMAAPAKGLFLVKVMY